MALRRVVEGIDTTVHGFRSSFSSWAADKAVPKDIRELCLGHVNSKTELKRHTIAQTRSPRDKNSCRLGPTI